MPMKPAADPVYSSAGISAIRVESSDYSPLANDISNDASTGGCSGTERASICICSCILTGGTVGALAIM